MKSAHYLISIIILIASPKASASDEAIALTKLCSLPNRALEREVPVLGGVNPGNFVRATQDGKYIMFTGSIPVPSKMVNGFPISFEPSTNNYMMELDTGELKILPGQEDAIPNGDLFLTYNGNKGVEFYSYSKNMKDKNSKLLHADPTLVGSYPSIGTISGDPLSNEPRTIRAIVSYFDINTVENKLAMRDYSVDPKTNKVESLGTSRTLCPGLNLALPKISNNGKRLSAFDNNSGSSKIYDVKDDGQCTEFLDLKKIGLQNIGKADFSLDNNKVTYAMLYNINVERYLSNWGSTGFWDHSDVFTTDLTTGKTKQITQNISGNSYFPTFLPNEKVLYFKRDVKPKYKLEFNISDPSKVNEFEPKIESVACDPHKNALSMVALGSLFDVLCRESKSMAKEINPQSMALNSLSLDPEKCKVMVKNYWEDKKAEIIKKPLGKKSPDGWSGKELPRLVPQIEPNKLKELSVEDLLAVCPTN